MAEQSTPAAMKVGLGQLSICHLKREAVIRSVGGAKAVTMSAPFAAESRTLCA